MKFIGKTLIFMALLAGGVVLKGSEKESEADKKFRRSIRASGGLDGALLDVCIDDGYVTDKVRTLLLLKANPNAIITKSQRIDTRGLLGVVVTPLLRAIEEGHVEAVELMLCQGADVNQGVWMQPYLGQVIQRIIGYNSYADKYTHIVDLLLYHGANPNTGMAHLGHFMPRLKLLLPQSFSRNYDFRCLNEAAVLCLEYGADDTLKNFDGKTIYDYALEENPTLHGLLKDRLTDRREKVKQKIADAIPRMGHDPVGVVAGYVI